MSRLRNPVRDDEHVRGPARAAVTLVEYGDYQCPFCEQAFWVLRNLEVRFLRDLRFVFRNFPLVEIHPLAMRAAEAAEAAAAQGKFWEMHDMLYEHQPEFEHERLVAYAAALGLDVAAFTEDVLGHRHISYIRADFMSGVRSGVNGTPSLFINGHRFDGPAEEALLASAIESVLEGQRRAHAH